MLDAFPGERVNARVSKISREGTLVSDVVEYDVMVEPLRVPSHWASGMTANVEFSVASKENILLIPRSALVEENGQQFLTVRTSVPVRRRIETGITDGKMVEVVEGLREGDHLILAQGGTSSKRESGQDNSRRMRMMMGPR